MKKDNEMTDKKSEGTVSVGQGKAVEGATRVELDKVAERLLDKYEIAFLELAK